MLYRVTARSLYAESVNMDVPTGSSIPTTVAIAARIESETDFSAGPCLDTGHWKARMYDCVKTARAAFLERNCGDDAELRNEIEELLRSHDAPGVPDTAPHAPDMRKPIHRWSGH